MCMNCKVTKIPKCTPNLYLRLVVYLLVPILYYIYVQSSIGRALNNMIKRSRGVGSNRVF